MQYLLFTKDHLTFFLNWTLHYKAMNSILNMNKDPFLSMSIFPRSIGLWPYRAFNASQYKNHLNL